MIGSLILNIPGARDNFATVRASARFENISNAIINTSVPPEPPIHTYASKEPRTHSNGNLAPSCAALMFCSCAVPQSDSRTGASTFGP